MTKQETFDIIVNHLRKQSKKSEHWNDYHEFTECLYRGPDGLKCAVGCLIPDENYSEDMEGTGIQTELNLIKYNMAPSKVDRILMNLGHDIDLCSDLQAVHDWCGVEDWEGHLERVAINHSLIYTNPGSI